MMQIRSRIRAAAVAGVCLLYIAGGSIANAGTLLPNGEQTFTDSNGLPLSAGCIFMYVPGTLTSKATYQNSAQTIANTNPVQLDAAGRAIIYGTGTYRQIVTASNGTLTPCSPAGTQIWDQLTASTDSSATIYAGASSGTPNSVTVIAPAFSGTDGQVINYISTNTNTGGSTFNPSGFGAVQIVRDSATGPGALTGGELVATNAVSLIYDATAGTFHILSPITWPNTSGVPVGSVIDVAGFAAPQNYAFTYGQAISRTTYSSLLAALTLAQSGVLASGSPTITGLSDTTQLGAGQPVESVGIPAGATIVSCAPTTCTLSANATTTRTGTVTFFAYGNGDGSTTFNLPDHRGLFFGGRDNMGGAARGILTTALGSGVGAQTTTLLTSNLPAYTPSGSIANGAITSTPTGANLVGATGTGIGTGGLSGAVNVTGLVISSTQATSTFTGTAQGGTSTPFSRTPLSTIINRAIRLVP